MVGSCYWARTPDDPVSSAGMHFVTRRLYMPVIRALPVGQSPVLQSTLPSQSVSHESFLILGGLRMRGTGSTQSFGHESLNQSFNRSIVQSVVWKSPDDPVGSAGMPLVTRRFVYASHSSSWTLPVQPVSQPVLVFTRAKCSLIQSSSHSGSHSCQSFGNPGHRQAAPQGSAGQAPPP